MDCLVCGGACCEDLVFPERGLTRATVEFFKVRCGASVQLTPGERGFVFPVRCRHLSTEGACLIYDDRPLICAVYVAGDEPCLATLRRRRSPRQIEKIRG